MTSTKSSILKRVADSFSINRQFHKRGHDIIDVDKRYLVSPADSTLFHHGDIDEDGYIISKHGKKVFLEELIGDDAKRFRGGYYINLYLAPTDRHYFVMPYAGVVRSVQKNECKTWVPIIIGLDNYVGRFDMFSRAVRSNASIGLVVDAKRFSYAMIAVGSLNVNHITVECLKEHKYKKGYHAGYFSVGSTIVLCVDKNYQDMKLLCKTGHHLKIGERLLQI